MLASNAAHLAGTIFVNAPLMKYLDMTDIVLQFDSFQYVPECDCEACSLGDATDCELEHHHGVMEFPACLSDQCCTSIGTLPIVVVAWEL